MSKADAKSFIDLCIEGKALLDDVDDFVAQWHERPRGSLHDFLGMTWAEYSLWASEPDILPQIVVAHRDRRTLKNVIEEMRSLPMAARSANPKQALKLTKWLERQGKIS